jgi:hypothetical protein
MPFAFVPWQGIGAEVLFGYGSVARSRDLVTRLRVFVQRGRVFVQRGRVFVQRGAVFVRSGRVFVQRGAVFVQRGRVFVQRGDVFVQRGHVFVQRGRLFVPRCDHKTPSPRPSCTYFPAFKPITKTRPPHFPVKTPHFPVKTPHFRATTPLFPAASTPFSHMPRPQNRALLRSSPDPYKPTQRKRAPLKQRTHPNDNTIAAGVPRHAHESRVAFALASLVRTDATRSLCHGYKRSAKPYRSHQLGR